MTVTVSVSIGMHFVVKITNNNIYYNYLQSTNSYTNIAVKHMLSMINPLNFET